MRYANNINVHTKNKSNKIGSVPSIIPNLTIKDGTQSLSPSKFIPTNSESDPDEIVITVNPNP